MPKARRIQDVVMTIDGPVLYLKLSASTLATSTFYQLGADGKVPRHKVGHHGRFHRAAADQWLGHEAKHPTQWGSK